MTTRSVRQRLLDRVDKHDGHWYWTGTLSNDVPVVQLDYVRHAARKLAWQVFISPDVPDRVRSTCGEICIRPEHLAAHENGCTDPTHTTDRWSVCNECRLQRRRRQRWTCGCGRSMLANNQWKHQQSCDGVPKTARRARSLPPTAITDAVADWKRGITPERIVRALETTPGALLQQYHRQKIDKPYFRRDLERLERERKCLQPGD